MFNVACSVLFFIPRFDILHAVSDYTRMAKWNLFVNCSDDVLLVDMQKFPLRMKDNDLLVTELYKDPNEDMVTALSVYLTPKTCE